MPFVSNQCAKCYYENLGGFSVKSWLDLQQSLHFFIKLTITNKYHYCERRFPCVYLQNGAVFFFSNYAVLILLNF